MASGPSKQQQRQDGEPVAVFEDRSDVFAGGGTAEEAGRNCGNRNGGGASGAERGQVVIYLRKLDSGRFLAILLHWESAVIACLRIITRESSQSSPHNPQP